MARKDRERFLRRKQDNPDYQGFRGAETVTVKAPPATESVVCSVCHRRRNAPVPTLPADRSQYVCLRCQSEAA